MIQSFTFDMARRRYSEATRWRIIGMKSTGMSCRAIGRQLDINHTVISRLVQKHRQTDHVKDRPRPGQPRKTSRVEDRDLARLVRRQPLSNSGVLKQLWLPNRPLCNRTVRNRLKAIGLKARRVIKRPALTNLHKRSRLGWCLARRHWNLTSWRKVHWSDESRFLLNVTDGRQRVWRTKNTAYVAKNVQASVPFGGGSVMVWGCVSHDCKLDLVTVQGNLNGDRYIREILQPVLVPHFDNHPLATRPVFMDDNARPHRSRLVTAFLENNAITKLPWPAMSPDLNPLEHIWDMIGRRVQALDPPPRTLAGLEAAIHREWQQLPLQRIRRLTSGMRRRVEAVIRAHGGYTRY